MEISDKNYYDYPALSASQLKDYDESPYHFWKRSVYNSEAIKIDTKSTNFGSLAHCLLLEPKKFEENYIVNLDNLDFRTKEGKDWKNKQTKEIVSLNDYQHAKKMINNLYEDRFVGALLKNGISEKPFIVDIGDGFWLKGKTDSIKKLSNGDIIIIDYKTTSEDLDKWEKRNVYNGHDIQNAVYAQLCYLKYKTYPKHFYFLVQSTKEDYEDLYQIFEYDMQSVDRAIDYVFGKNRDVNFKIENDEVLLDDDCGILYKCKRDLYNFFSGKDLDVFKYFKEVKLMSNMYREFKIVSDY